ncbi:hypothetical protein RRG08_004160 [Elysia crispata]|uniref:Uncharacterized protein n=1 Tax=Elysia crispata TaxID=231223 RepID=A0AAE1D5Q1_9GAST|nr:hypothetical protein RRG08_004160 [Elysia crispata]
MNDSDLLTLGGVYEVRNQLKRSPAQISVVPPIFAVAKFLKSQAFSDPKPQIGIEPKISRLVLEISKALNIGVSATDSSSSLARNNVKYGKVEINFLRRNLRFSNNKTRNMDNLLKYSRNQRVEQIKTKFRDNAQQYIRIVMT